MSIIEMAIAATSHPDMNKLPDSLKESSDAHLKVVTITVTAGFSRRYCYSKDSFRVELPAQQISKYQRSHDGGIAFHNEFRRMNIELASGYLFIRHGATVRAVRCGAVADLAEVTPERYVMPLKVLIHHGHHAYREVAGDTAAYLEETYAFAC